MEHPTLVSDDEPAMVIDIDRAIPAGFPRQEDAVTNKERIDLNKLLIHSPTNTYLFKVSGESMSGAGIHNGHHVLVDRALPRKHGRIVLAIVNREYTIKHLHQRGNAMKLLPANADFPPIIPLEGDEVEIWGVVTVSFMKHV